jgi:hypothetical protein
MNAATLGVCAPNMVERQCTTAAGEYREGGSGSIPSSRVSNVQTLAFVLLEPSEGKLSCSVPRGLGAGNRAWLPGLRREAASRSCLHEVGGDHLCHQVKLGS